MFGAIPKFNLSDLIYKGSISAPNSKSSLAFDDLAKTLLSDSEEMITSRHGMAGFFANMARGKRFT